MTRGNGITKSTMVEAGFWRELLTAADSRGGIRLIAFGDGSTVVYDPTLRTGVLPVPDDLMYGPPGMKAAKAAANGGPQVHTFPGVPAAQPAKEEPRPVAFRMTFEYSDTEGMRVVDASVDDPSGVVVNPGPIPVVFRPQGAEYAHSPHASPDAPRRTESPRVVPDTPTADSAPPGASEAREIPEVGEIDLSVPLRRSRLRYDDPQRFGRFVGPDDFPGEDFPSRTEQYCRK